MSKEYRLQHNYPVPVNGPMAVGLKILIVLFMMSFIALGIIVLRTNPNTAPAFECFVATGGCVTTDPTDLVRNMMSR